MLSQTDINAMGVVQYPAPKRKTPWDGHDHSIGEVFESKTRFEEDAFFFVDPDRILGWDITFSHNVRDDDLYLVGETLDEEMPWASYSDKVYREDNVAAFDLIATPKFRIRGVETLGKPVAFLSGYYEFLPRDAGSMGSGRDQAGKQEWDLDVKINNLFVSHPFRNHGAASALIEVFCAAVELEVYALEHLLKEVNGKKVDLEINALYDRETVGSFMLAKKFMTNLSERFGVAEVSFFVSALPEHVELRNFFEKTKDWLDDSDASKLEEILEMVATDMAPVTEKPGGFVSTRLIDRMVR